MRCFYAADGETADRQDRVSIVKLMMQAAAAAAAEETTVATALTTRWLFGLHHHSASCETRWCYAAIPDPTSAPTAPLVPVWHLCLSALRHSPPARRPAAKTEHRSLITCLPHLYGRNAVKARSIIYVCVCTKHGCYHWIRFKILGSLYIFT